MNVLQRKLRRDFLSAKGMLGAVVAIVAFGVAALVGFQTTTNNLTDARDAYYNQCRMADVWVDLKKVPLSALPRLERIQGIAELRSRISQQVIVDLQGVAQPIAGRLLSMPSVHTPVINDLVLTAGNWFSGNGAEEVIVSQQFADARGLKPGDQLHLTMDGQRKSLRIVGLGISAEFVYLIPPGGILPTPADYGVFYVTRHFAENSLGMSGAANSLVARLTAQASQAPEAVMQQLSEQLHPYGVFAVTARAQQGSNLSLSSELGGLATMAAMMPLIFLSVAALVLNVLMTRLAAQQRVVVGTLKALGYDNRTLFAHFIQVGLLVGLAGGLLGLLLGYGLAALLTDFYKAFFTFPALPNQLYLGLMLVALCIALLFSVLGSLRGVSAVIKLEPAEAMRPPAPPAGGAIILERWPWLWQRVGFFWQIALRNLFRNRVRSLVGIIASALGTALLVSTFGLTDSLKYMVQFQFDKVMLADYELSFRQDLPYDALAEAQRLPGVLRAEPLFAVDATFINVNHRYQGAIIGVTPDATMTVPNNADGTPAAIPTQGLLMARRLAEQLDLGIGDSVWILPSKGDQTPLQAPVVGFVDSLFGLAVYADYGYLNRLRSESGAVSAVRLKTAQTAAEQTAFLAELKRLPTLLNLQDMAEQRANMWETFVVKMGSMANMLILFGAVIFFGAILNGALISLIERQRELATYRVIGYHNGEVGAMYLRETLVLNLCGILLGLPLGWWMLLGLNSEYKNDLYMMPTVITPGGWLWSIGLAIAFVLIAQLIVQHRINRMHWNDALSMKE